jgi:hypothetical protein
MDFLSNSISISDVYIIFRLINNINLTSKSHRYFNTSEWSQISTSIGSKILNIPGNQSIILNNPQNGGSSNYYLIITGKL